MRFIAAIVLSLACGATRPDAAEPPAPAELMNSIGMRFVVIPAGEFFMGSDPREIRRLSAEMPKRETLYGSENRSNRDGLRRLFPLAAPRSRLANSVNS